jgi:hypothetical protein
MPVLVERNDHRRATRRLTDDRCGAEIPITLRVLTGWVNRLKTAKQAEVRIEGNHAVRIRRVTLPHQCDHPGSRPIHRFRWPSGRLDLARMNS